MVIFYPMKGPITLGMLPFHFLLWPITNFIEIKFRPRRIVKKH